MSKNISKLHLQHSHQQTEQTNALHQVEQKHEAHQFASVEEMIRTDKEHIEVPPVIAERLNESIAREPKTRSWWKRVFGR